MTWVRKDDGAALHRKFFRAGVAAYGWWDAGLCYCNKNLTDGFLPARDLGLVFPGTLPDAVMAYTEALVREQSLHVATAGQPVVCHSKSKFCPRAVPIEDGYVMHDYFEYQPRRVDVLRTRAEVSHKRSVAGRKGGEKSGERRKQTGKQIASPETTLLLPTVRSPVPVPVPVPVVEPKATPRRRGVVLADDLFIAELRDDPAYKGIDVDREVAKLDRWLKTPRGRGKVRSQQRLVNWLNNAEPNGNGGPPDRRKINDAWKGKTQAGDVTI